MPKMLMAAPRYPSVPEWIESLYQWTQSWLDCAKELFLQGTKLVGMHVGAVVHRAVTY